MSMPERQLYERPQVKVTRGGWGVMEDLLALTLRALSDKALFWTVTLATIAMWGFAMAHPDQWHIGAAVGFSLCVFFPMLWKGR